MTNETIKKLSVTIAVAAESEDSLNYLRTSCERVDKLYDIIFNKYTETNDTKLLLLACSVLDAKIALEESGFIADHIRRYPELTQEEADPYTEKGAD